MIRLKASYGLINFCIFIILSLIFIYAASSNAFEISFQSPEVTSEIVSIPKDPNYSKGIWASFLTSMKNKIYSLFGITKPTVPKTEVETKKYTGENVGVYVFQGYATKILDRFYIDENFGDTGVSIYAIFDGHTSDFAVTYVVKNLMESLKEKIKDLKQATNLDKNLKTYMKDGIIKYEELLKHEILAVEKSLLTRLRERQKDSGTTVLIALIDEGKLFVANVGDSRGVMIKDKKNIKDLSEDHKPNKKKEKERIEKSHGEVKCKPGSKIPLIDGYPVSRTIGDERKKTLKHIIADPDTFEYDLKEFEPKFIILATNGLWNKLSSNEVSQLINDKNILHEELFGAKYIANKAYQYGSNDTITVILIKNIKV